MAETRGTPEWWRDRLAHQLLVKDRPGLFRLDRYYDGDHPLPHATADAEAEFQRFLKMSRSNWMGLVVDAVCERLEVVGVRLPGTRDADTKLWQIWQANSLDADSELVHTDAAVFGRSYVSVWPDDDRPSTPRIVPEHPTEMIVATAPGRHRERLAALKVWYDDTAQAWNATLYMPEAVYKWAAPGRAAVHNSRTQRVALAGWEIRRPAGEEWPLENPFDRVGVVPFRNRARTIGEGRSEIADVIDIQDRINKTIFDRLMASEFSSFRQRWATGINVPKDPVTAEPVAPFKAAVDRVWTNGNPEGKFGEFGEHDLQNFIRAVEADVQHIAAQTRTPPHYLLGQSGAFPSGESLKATETGLVAKARKRMRHHGESWEEVCVLVGQAVEDESLQDTSMEIMWKDPESRTEGELVDALVKMQGLGVPNEALQERWGASPQQIARWRVQMAEQRVTELLEQPEAPPAPTSA